MVNLSYLSTNYKIFVDTCSLLHEGAKAFFLKILIPELMKNSMKIIIPLKILNEINTLKDSENKVSKNLIRNAITILNEYQKFNLADIRGERDDTFADNLFITIFTKFRIKHNLALITQDKYLALEILNLKLSKSVKSDKNIKAYFINNNGTLDVWSKTKIEKQHEYSFKNTSKFKIGDKPITSNKLLDVKFIPDEGDEIITKNNGKRKLLKNIGVGGEGNIYEIGNNLVCKIYKKEKITNTKLEKIRLILDNPMEIRGVCWPKDFVFNKEGDFIGYVMDQAYGKPMQKVMFIKQLFKKNLPDWNKRHLVELSICILNKIRILSMNNVIMGDINPLNILINNENDVYFVDTDSYQIENFPSPVGTINFTAPEIQNKDFNTFLRTREHENFAIATLLFMIMLPGKPPYSHQGGGNPGKNIINQEFSYPLGEKSNNKTPEGPWRFMWSHLPYNIKKAFYETFRENKRRSVDEWLYLLKRYEYSLEKEFVSDELYPSNFKPISEYAQKEYGAKIEKRREIECVDCDNIFFIKEKQESDFRNKGWEIPKRCPECRKLRKIENESKNEEKENGEWIKCISCKKTFLFSEKEKQFFAKKGFNPPRRCKNCRNKSEIYQKPTSSSSFWLNLLKTLFNFN